MKLLDINVLVNAFRSDAPQHASSFAFLSNARQGHEPIIVLPEVAVGFVRIVTRRGIFAEPDDSATAMSALTAWCSAPAVLVREAGAGRWAVFASLMEAHALNGNDVHDGLLAAAAIDMGATLVTADRGFARFAGLHLQLL